MSEARREYESRLSFWRSREQRHVRLDGAQTWAYVAAIAGVVAVLYLVVERQAISPAWLALPGASLLALAVAGAAVARRVRRARRAIAFYERGLARLDGQWPSTGPTGEIFAPEDHPFARDLDIVGPRSLFQLLCTARTRAGEAVLARWLLTRPALEEVRARQELVGALRGRLDLR